MSPNFKLSLKWTKFCWIKSAVGSGCWRAICWLKNSLVPWQHKLSRYQTCCPRVTLRAGDLQKKLTWEIIPWSKGDIPGHWLVQKCDPTSSYYRTYWTYSSSYGQYIGASHDSITMPQTWLSIGGDFSLFQSPVDLLHIKQLDRGKWQLKVWKFLELDQSDCNRNYLCDTKWHLSARFLGCTKHW